MARDLIRNSVIEDAIAQRIAQIVEFIHEDRIKPQRAYTRADMEAAIQRALEGAAQSVDCACAGREAVLQCSHRNSRTRWECCGEANCSALEAADIRALDPAQFIKEPKP
jgi:hypothetical protein